jgi:hypothetical protein
LEITNNAVGFEIGSYLAIGREFTFDKEGFDIIDELLLWDF